jgi:hypothetical protein
VPVWTQALARAVLDPSAAAIERSHGSSSVDDPVLVASPAARIMRPPA